MIKTLLLLAITTHLFAFETSEKLFECTEIFKERKGELLVKLERIDEQKQALSALKIATEELLEQKETKLTLREQELDKKLANITAKEKNVKEMLAKHEEILKELKSTKMKRIAQTFAKMKPASAANILADMPNDKAKGILLSLQPKVVGKILAKMDAKRAAQLTQLLSE